LLPNNSGNRRLPDSKVDEAELSKQARLAVFALINSFLAQQRTLSEYLDLRPTHALVYLTVAVASIQRYVRRPDLDEKYRGVEPLPNDALGSISRRAIASATGLPRETARRIINDLLGSGYLREVDGGAVTSRVAELVPERTQTYLLALAKETSRLVDELAKLGVIVAR
jgi:hypothetical protein